MSAEEGQKLSDAAYAGDLSKLEELIDAGINVNTCDADGFTALHRSCVTGRLDVIRLLISKHADVNAEDSYGDSPMHYACFCGHVDAVHMLLEAGADPNKPSKDGKTPLESAREEGHEAVVRLLNDNSTGGGGGSTKVAGLDFSHGVIIEGELKKKRANLVVKWRKKYYVFSRIYGAMFFWTGSKTTVEGVIKKVRFETFLSIRQLDKYNGRRIDLRVITGRRMRLLAASATEAKRWVETIKQHLGHLMAVVRVQTAFRVFRARKMLRRMIAERQAAVKRMVASSTASFPAASADGILHEGPLRKKNSRGIGRMFTAFRTRYFVLNVHEASMFYFESKAKRKLGVRPRAIPFLSFYSVKHVLDKRDNPTKKFHLRVVSGRVFEFECKDTKDAKSWVGHLNSVLPRDNVAAVKIQSVVRMHLAKRVVAARRREMSDKHAVLAAKYGKDYATLERSAIKVQALSRGRATRVKAAKLKAAKAEAEKKMADVKARRVWLRGKDSAGAAGAAGAGAAAGGASESTHARLQRLKALKAKKAQKAWIAHVDETTGKTYWHNSETGESTWEDPTGDDADGDDGGAGEGGRVPAPTSPTADGSAKPTTDRWDVAQDDDGNVYYVNRESGESVWERPDDFQEWVEELDPTSDKVYYFNRITKESVWERPADFVKVIGDWEERANEEGQLYYYNRTRGESVWEKPAGFGRVTAAVVDVNADSDDDGDSSDDEVTGWTKQIDPSTNREYWYHAATQESSWTKPSRRRRLSTMEPELELDPSEVLAFSSWVNAKLDNGAGGRGGGHLPLDIDADSPQLLPALRSGVLLCQLVNSIVPDTVDERVLDAAATPSDTPSATDPSPAYENLQLGLSSMQSIGAVVGNVSATDLEAGKPEAVMDTVWQAMKLDVMSNLDIKKASRSGGGSHLLALRQEDEELTALLQLTPDKVLLRWLNYHLERAGYPTTVTAVGEQLQDGLALSALLRVLAPDYCAGIPEDVEACKALESTELIAAVLGAAFGVGVQPWFSVEAIASGNMRLQLAFLASLHSVAPGMDKGSAGDAASDSVGAGGAGAGAGSAPSKPVRVDVAEMEAELADLIKEEADAEGESRESRTMKQWLNSLNLPRVYVHSLFQDSRDGVILLKALDHIEPGIVNWRRANTPKSQDVALNRYKRVENCNYVIDLCKAMDLTIVNVAGLDIVDGNPKLLLALLWQTMRYHTLKILSSAGDGFEMEEDDIVEWANEKVSAESGGKCAPMSGFNDSNLSSSVFLMHLLNSVRGIVNWDLVSRGRTDAEKTKNAQYLISVARKMGAAVFCTWEDIVAVRPKMIMMLVASVMVVDNKRREAAGGAADEDDDDAYAEYGYGESKADD